jgi:hypothetical protein
MKYSLNVQCQFDDNTIKYMTELLTIITGAFSPEHPLWETAHTPLMETAIMFCYSQLPVIY